MKQVAAVLNPRVIRLIEGIVEETRTGKPAFSVNPYGTLQYLKQLSLLYVSMASAGRYKFSSVLDVRLQECVSVVALMKRQRAAIAAHCRALGHSEELIARRHVPHQTFTALQRCVAGMVVQLYQKPEGCPSIVWPTSDRCGIVLSL